MASARPSGTVPFVFTDIAGSTRRWEQDPPAMQADLAHHDEVLRAAFATSGGHVFKTVGDGFCVAFATVPAALRATLLARRRLDSGGAAEHDRLRIRIAVHTGTSDERDGDYFGPTLNRVARLLASAHGDQILLSEVAAGLVRDTLPSGATLRDCGEHYLRDLSRPETIFQLLHPDIACDLSPLQSVDRAPNNLPDYLTNFVGRENEIQTVRGLLANSRLVTITGAGGSGKTRLAIHVAGEFLGHYPDGLWFVDLAVLANPELVAPTVASTLGAPENTSISPLNNVISAIEHRTLLIILDNCEHLESACATLIDGVLRACPGVSILATSRAALGTAGETTWQVPSLSLPEPQEQPTLKRLIEYEGVRLFADRAAAIEPSFMVTADNATAIVNICRHLDGIPLAIELAAARVQVLTPQKIADRLRDRFRLLTSGNRSALPRQKTLCALVDWSYELLSTKERLLLHRLALFAGGWTLEAGEAVASGDPIDSTEVLDLLAQLVDKSLVVTDEHQTERRFRYLETLREYALERLRSSGEESIVRQRHLEWFTANAEETLARLNGPGQAALFDALEAEHDNMRAALTWSQETGNGLETSARLAHALTWFWALRGYRREGEESLANLLRQAREPTVARAHLLMASAVMAVRGGHPEEALIYLEEGLALARSYQETRLTALALARLGLVRQARGEFDEAWLAFEESQSAFDLVGGESGLDAPIAVYRAQVAKERGDAETAAALFEDGVALSRARGDSHGVSSGLRSLAELSVVRGDLDRAEALFDESVRLLRELGDKPCALLAFEWLANIAVQRGQIDRGTRLLAISSALREETGGKLSTSQGEKIDRDLAKVRGALDESTFAEIWDAGRMMSLDEACTYALDES